jgi:hypothetical protein
MPWAEAALFVQRWNAQRVNAIRQTEVRDRRNDLHADGADVHRLGNQCGCRAEQPHGRSPGRADDLIRVLVSGDRASTDPGSFQSLR